jgi:hypothetical protein
VGPEEINYYSPGVTHAERAFHNPSVVDINAKFSSGTTFYKGGYDDLAVKETTLISCVAKFQPICLAMKITVLFISGSISM